MNLDVISGCFFGFGLGDPTKTFASGGAFSPGGPSGGSRRVLEVIFKRILGLHDVSSGESLGAPFFADRCGGDQRCYLGQRTWLSNVPFCRYTQLYVTC